MPEPKEPIESAFPEGEERLRIVNEIKQWFCSANLPQLVGVHRDPREPRIGESTRVHLMVSDHGVPEQGTKYVYLEVHGNWDISPAVENDANNPVSSYGLANIIEGVRLYNTDPSRSLEGPKHERDEFFR